MGLSSYDKAYINLANSYYNQSVKSNKVELTIPDNIVLLFQPPYSPDVNPIERVWKFMKDKLRWINLKTLDELRK